MSDGAPWVCGNCRSINDDRAQRCYSCRTPRTLALDLSSTAAPIRMTEETPPEVQAALARRAGASYASSASQATLVEVAIITVTIVSLISLSWLIWTVDRLPNADIYETLSDLTLLLLIGAVELVAWIAASIAWGAWLSRVVANVPALGAGWPRATPRTAFISSVIPIYNIYASTSVLRDAMTRLSAPGKARTGLLTAWWLALFFSVLPTLGLIPGPTFIIRLGYRFAVNILVTFISQVTGSEIGANLVIDLINGGLLVIAAALALKLVWHVEDLQQERISFATAGA